MRCAPIAATAVVLLALAACNNTQPEKPQSESATDYAQRIGGSAPQQQAIATQQPGNAAHQQPGAGQPPHIAPPATPTTACGASRVAPFYGRLADDANRKAIMEAVAPLRDVRFLQPGSVVSVDPSSTRLNIMLDANGIMRDARCG